MKGTRILLFGKSLFIAFVATVVTTCLIVYLTGLTTHRSIIENSFYSLSILSLCFSIFLTTGLYNGLNIVDNLSHKLEVSWRKNKKGGESSFLDLPTVETPDVGDGIEGVIIGILLWILVTILLTALLFFLSTFLWASFIVFTIAIYWIFIRALKLVFSKSAICKDDLFKSMRYGLSYTLLFTGWLYGLIYVT